MAFVIELDPPLENGTDYILRGDVTQYSAGSFTFTVDDGVTTQTIGSVSALGVFGLTFTANADHTELEFNDLFGGDLQDLALQLDPDGLDQLCSECFDLQTSHACPGQPELEIIATNDENVGDLAFGDLPYSMHILLNGGIRAGTYQYEDETIFKFSNGEKKLLYADKRKGEDLYVHDIPDYLHDALSQALMLDDVTINGVEYIKKEGDYTPEWDIPQSLMAGVIVPIEEKTQTNKNSNCG